MNYVEFLKTKIDGGKLRHVFLPYDAEGRIHLPEQGENPCDSCGSHAPYKKNCYHHNKCGAQQYYLKKEKAIEDNYRSRQSRKDHNQGK